jgi:hypothetical protein
MILEFLQSITGVFVVVYDGQHGLRFTLGRAQEVVGPGVHFKFPIIQKFEVRETKHTTLDLEPQVIQLEDDLVYEIDAKVMYQIVDLKKAVIEIDELTTGLQNRVVMAVQHVVQGRDRRTILDTGGMIEEILAELREVEAQWGVRILQFGFSNISPSPASLEITQLDLLARERVSLYRGFRDGGLPEESAVALVTGAVVTTYTPGRGTDAPPLAEEVTGWIQDEELEAAEKERKRGKKPDAGGDQAEDEEPDEEE